MAALPTINGPSVNYFDGIVAIWLLIGVFRGRKRGMTQELLPTLQWLAIVVLAGLFYDPFSKVIAISTSGAFSLLWANLTAYVLIAFAIHLLYLWLKQVFGEKLVGSDYFGRAEYYLGMVAGLVRFACIVVVLCAVMHARVYTTAELAENEKMQKKSFEEVRFPTYMTIQHSALVESFTGQMLEGKLNRILIVSAAPGKKSTDTIAKRKEDSINAILGPVKK